MAKNVAVQQKISCVFVTGVQNEPSSKRSHQPFKVTASDRLNAKVVPHDIDSALVTEKLDGTCCLIQEHQGKAWLWPRLDRRLNRAGEKRLQQFQKRMREFQESGETENQPTIEWDPQKDFKKVPDAWIPATGVEMKDGLPIPDKIGHTPGWVPVEKGSRQHCWHLAAVDLDLGLGLTLALGKDSKELVVQCCPLSQLCGKTCELIGTSINGNPYGLGSKAHPVHVLVVHGSMPVVCPSPLNGPPFQQWLREGDGSNANKIEGVVWHCPSGAMFKVHRHHLNLPWPIKEPRLSQQPVRIDVDSAAFGIHTESASQFSLFASVNGQRVDHLCDLNTLLSEGR